jgi:hypothetical protein
MTRTTTDATASARAVRARCQMRWMQAGGPKMGPRDIRSVRAH